MGFLTNLLPGLRDLRTPLAVGAAWLLAIWLLFLDSQWAHHALAGAQETLRPVENLYNATQIHVGAIIAAAYLVGSIMVVRTSTFALSQFALAAVALRFGTIARLRGNPTLRDFVVSSFALNNRVEHSDAWRLASWISGMNIPVGAITHRGDILMERRYDTPVKIKMRGIWGHMRWARKTSIGERHVLALINTLDGFNRNPCPLGCISQTKTFGTSTTE